MLKDADQDDKDNDDNKHDREEDHFDNVQSITGIVAPSVKMNDQNHEAFLR